MSFNFPQGKSIWNHMERNGMKQITNAKKSEGDDSMNVEEVTRAYLESATNLSLLATSQTTQKESYRQREGEAQGKGKP
ncbi:hypothetical protein V6N11_080056 [Hibiscus sabdariffa]|uniref:Uncharacterized protein n=1 Tax=Hibiscus sabdariffa TaxID=183260 RepID=A0ABR2RXA9_9ROSI